MLPPHDWHEWEWEGVQVFLLKQLVNVYKLNANYLYFLLIRGTVVASDHFIVLLVCKYKATHM